MVELWHDTGTGSTYIVFYPHVPARDSRKEDVPPCYDITISKIYSDLLKKGDNPPLSSPGGTIKGYPCTALRLTPGRATSMWCDEGLTYMGWRIKASRPLIRVCSQNILSGDYTAKRQHQRNSTSVVSPSLNGLFWGLRLRIFTLLGCFSLLHDPQSEYKPVSSF